MNGMLSIIIPSYNEMQNIRKTADTVQGIMTDAGINCEIIFVSDGSTDKTFETIKEISQKDSRIRGIEFSRNFGKEAAILAGFEVGKGDCFAVMDCDLQHPPEKLVEMYHLWEQGYEIIEGIKTDRGRETAVHKGFAKVFYKIISGFTGFDMENTSDFKLIDKKVAEIILNMKERRTFFRALTFWTGYKSVSVYYQVAKREIGKSKWSPMSLVNYAISNIVSFSSAPLNIVTYIGVVALIFSLIVGIQTFVKWCTGTAVEGFTTAILLILIIGGFIMLGLGIIGKYIAAIYDEIKARPRYLIGRTTDTNNKGGQKGESE